MLKKEYEILLPFAREPWRKLTFGEVKKLSKKRSESYVFNSLKKFVKRGVLKEKKAGNVVLYSANLESLKTQAYIGFIAEFVAWGRKQVPYRAMENIAEKIPTPFYTLMITGSYANGTQRKDSDIDVVVVVDDNANPKKIYAELRMECEFSIPPIHLYAFRNEEFLGMLLDKKANYGKEIARNNLLIFGAENYYQIISEAVENGFDG